MITFPSHIINRSVCGSLSTDILNDCNNPMVAGQDDEVLLINVDDISVVTKNVTNPLVIEAITLAAGGKKAFNYEGKNGSVQATFNLVKKDFAEVYEHIVTLKVFKNDGDTKKQIEALAQGRVVAIVQNLHKGVSGNAAYEVYGIETGLVATVIGRNASDDATQGAYSIELKTSPKSSEPHTPASFFKTDYATTKGLVNGLRTATI